MKKIIIIGCPGSGKTTFAVKLANKLGIKLFHLDAIYHKPDKTHISSEEFDDALSNILSLDSYIIDGNYNRTIERRISACDTVFLFDLPTNVCIEGALSRVGKPRPDMPWVETELDPDFKEWISSFSENSLPKIYALIESYRVGKNIVIFKSREEADAFLEGNRGTDHNDNI